MPMEIAGIEEEKSAVHLPELEGSIHSNHVQSEYPRLTAAVGKFLREANPNLGNPLNVLTDQSASSV